jgi:transposase InsO family protein
MEVPMAWRNVKVEDLREYLVQSYVNNIASMKELCKECGVSRKTGYKWLQRYQESGKKGLIDHSRAPLNPERKFSNDQINTCLELKQKYPKYGPKKIHVLLKKHYPEIEWPCSTRLYEIFKEYHLVCSRKLKRRVPRTHPLGEVNGSNDVWCADFKGWFMTKDNTKIEPFTVTDGYSRFIIRCTHLERKRAGDVWKILSQAFHEYGLPKRFRTDNGPPFATIGVGRLSELSVNLIKAGVMPEWINPGHPEENGRHERFHKSLKDAIATPPADNFLQQISVMKAFTEEYNFERPHEALNMEVPGSIYSPSQRIWDGNLRSPEYDSNKMLRKVGENGCINLSRKEHYLGTVISGEYVSLDEVDNDSFQVHYGPVYLGTLIRGEGFIQPKRKECYRRG